MRSSCVSSENCRDSKDTNNNNNNNNNSENNDNQYHHHNHHNNGQHEDKGGEGIQFLSKTVVWRLSFVFMVYSVTKVTICL